MGGRILLTGASGQLGGALLRELARIGEVFAPGRAEMDLGDAVAIRRAMRDFRPRWVVNAGAYTAVDRAESEKEQARAVNAIAAGVIGKEAHAIGAVVAHFSTGYVFDGFKRSPYVETDTARPLNAYGQSKLDGERALAASRSAHLIFRTGWVYGAVRGGAGKNFVASILRRAGEQSALRIVADQHGTPTSSAALAQMTGQVISQLEAKAVRDRTEVVDAAAGYSGVYHATGSGETTWFGFAEAIVSELQRLRPQAKLAAVQAITTAEYPVLARRPANSRLNCTKLERTFGCRLPEWEKSVRQTIVESLENEAQPDY